MQKKHILFVIIILSFTSFISCKEEVLPKPEAFLSLNYPEPKYETFNEASCFQFKYNKRGNIKHQKDCNLQVVYPKLKATVYLSYKMVNKNLNVLLRDAQKLTYEHVIKADEIIEQPFVNGTKKSYGMFYEVGGNAASQSQFYLTDSTKHFLVGSVYFYAKPNFDSILPAAEYIKNDLRVIMETLEWKK